MTVTGAGGVVLTALRPLKRFGKDFQKLDSALQDKVKGKLDDLLKDPRPPGLCFEKLKGHSNPDVYTVHVTGNYKISFEINGGIATLRRVSTHNEIDRQP